MLNIIINGQGPEPPDTVYLSGGTIRLIEIMKRISRENDVNLYVISSRGVCNTFMKNGINANYKVSPFFLEKGHQAISVLFLILFFVLFG